MTGTKYAVVDLETTGHSPAKGDRIIQIAIVFIENDEITNTYTRFVHPQQPIPPFIQQLTSITDADVADAPAFEEIAEEVSELLSDSVFVAHNTDFDLSFLQNELKRCNMAGWNGKTVDTVELAKILYPALAGYRLQDIAEALSIDLQQAHRADDDALATARFLLLAKKKLMTLPRETLSALHARSFLLKSDVSSLVYEALRQTYSKEPAADYALYRGIAYKCTEMNAVREVFEFPQSAEEKARLLKQLNPKFTLRESQERMMDLVHEALLQKQNSAVEMPTGTGKTLGYVIPAVHQASFGKPVVISTFTNHLIEQLREEIEKMGTALGKDIPVTVMKGMSNYISLAKFEELLHLNEEVYDEALIAMQLLVWLTETETGDLDEVNASGGGKLFIDRVRKRSLTLKKDEVQADFHSRILARAQKSLLLLTNHAMLMSDQERANPLFSEASGIIIDEAHQLAQAAITSHLQVFSYTKWKYALGQLNANGSGQLLFEMNRILTRFHFNRKHMTDRLQQVYDEFAVVFDESMQVLARMKGGKGNGHPTKSSAALSKKTRSHQAFKTVLRKMEAYIDIAEQYAAPLAKLDLAVNEQAVLNEWHYWIADLKMKAGEWVELFLEEAPGGTVIWLEKDSRSLPSSIQLKKSPVFAGGAVQKFIGQFDGRAGVVLTSGTLTAGADRRFVLEQLGMDEEVPLYVFDAPKHFYEGAHTLIVENMPDIQQVSSEAYVEAVADALIQTAIAIDGKVFALFLSHSMLKETYDIVLDSGSLQDDYTLIAQGVSSGSRYKLLKTFKQQDKALLFGTANFFEGVDLPSEQLSAVVIVRLPFTSPDEPLYKARSAALKEEGKNAFAKLGLPEAVLRFRQGFGRLIRASDEKGYFIVLDRRIETKSYGSSFIASLPQSDVRKVSLETLVNEIENCYNNDGSTRC